MAAQAKKTNGFDKAKLKSYIERVENIKDDIDSETGAFMAKVKDMKLDIKDVLEDAKNDGIPLKALKAELKLRDFDRKKEKVVDGLEDDDANSLEMIREALGDFASLPLGEAAMRAA